MNMVHNNAAATTNAVTSGAVVFERPEFWWRQLPQGVDPIRGDINVFLQWIEQCNDPRVEEWPLMSSPVPTLIIAVLYVVGVYGGMFLMSKFDIPAFKLTRLMMVYNAVVVLLNGWMCLSLVEAAWRHGYKPVCNAVDYSDAQADVAWIVYVYYMSKLVDFSDTFFMVLRRKNNQVSFLHVYHHVAMWVIWWMAVKWAAGGDGIFGPLFNTFVHAVMYTYYLCTTLRITIPGKRYLTQLQMSQLFIVTIYGLVSVGLDCPYPHWTLCTQSLFLVSLLFLFYNFYRHAYKERQKGNKGAASGQRKKVE